LNSEFNSGENKKQKIMPAIYEYFGLLFMSIAKISAKSRNLAGNLSNFI